MKGLIPWLCLVFIAQAALAGENSTMKSIYEIPLKNIQGQPASLAAYKGQVLRVVNVASKCDFTKQYAALEALYAKYKDPGVQVLGFPCNDYGGQEPGTNEEIVQFCTMKYHVTFPLFGKLHCKAPSSTRFIGCSRAKARPSPATWRGTSRSSSSPKTAPSPRDSNRV